MENDKLYDKIMQCDVDRAVESIDLENYPEDFQDYVNEGKEMTRTLSQSESTWVYLNLK